MGKHEKGTPKEIANRSKSKGLQKLKLWVTFLSPDFSPFYRSFFSLKLLRDVSETMPRSKWIQVSFDEWSSSEAASAFRRKFESVLETVQWRVQKYFRQGKSCGICDLISIMSLIADSEDLPRNEACEGKWSLSRVHSVLLLLYLLVCTSLVWKTCTVQL